MLLQLGERGHIRLRHTPHTLRQSKEWQCLIAKHNFSGWRPDRRTKSSVIYDELSETDKKKFDASRFKEIDNLLKLNALSVISPEESDHFAKTTPENIIPTNMLDKWRVQDDGSVAAKSRSVLVGWKDPMIY